MKLIAIQLEIIFCIPYKCESNTVPRSYKYCYMSEAVCIASLVCLFVSKAFSEPFSTKKMIVMLFRCVHNNVECNICVSLFTNLVP